MIKNCFLIIYTFFPKYLTIRNYHFFSQLSKKIRYLCCENIFKYCGASVNIERKASFSNGFKSIISNDAMMASKVFDLNHFFLDTSVAMISHGK